MACVAADSGCASAVILEGLRNAKPESGGDPVDDVGDAGHLDRDLAAQAVPQEQPVRRDPGAPGGRNLHEAHAVELAQPHDAAAAGNPRPRGIAARGHRRERLTALARLARPRDAVGPELRQCSAAVILGSRQRTVLSRGRS
jgi:hypothetical protein